MAAPAKTVAKKTGPTKKAVHFTIELKKAVDDKVLVVSDYVSFLQSSIKVGGKAGALGELVTVTASGSKVTVTTTAKLAKRYLKYLTKKYLKKNSLREFMRVIATGRLGYELRYFKSGEGDAADAEDDE